MRSWHKTLLAAAALCALAGSAALADNKDKDKARTRAPRIGVLRARSRALDCRSLPSLARTLSFAGAGTVTEQNNSRMVQGFVPRGLRAENRERARRAER